LITHPPTPALYTLSLHDALPIYRDMARILYTHCASCHHPGGSAFSLMTYNDARPWAVALKEEMLTRRMPPWGAVKGFADFRNDQDRKSTRLNSSHVSISYAVFCL